MGRVTTEAVIESLGDTFAVGRGVLDAADVRRLATVARVDGDAKLLTLPTHFIDALGLRGGFGVAVAPVRLTVRGRSCTMDVTEGDAVVIGRLPLLALDLVVADGRLVGNPAHGGGEVIEAYLASGGFAVSTGDWP